MRPEFAGAVELGYRPDGHVLFVLLLRSTI
jgi:hypothetical protein